MTTEAIAKRHNRRGKATFGPGIALLAAFATLCDQVNLAAPVARGLRLAHVNLLEIALHQLLELGESFTLKSLDHEIAGLHPTGGKFERQLAQVNGTRLIRRFHP